MYISSAKGKLPIVRKRKATHAIVMAVCAKMKAAPCRIPLVRVRARLSWSFSPFVDETSKGKEQRVYHPSSARVPRFHYTYTESREGAIGAGVTPRRATMPTCTDARMRRVLHAFLHSRAHVHNAHMHAHTRIYYPTQAYVRTVSDLPSVHRGVSLLRRVVFYIMIEKRMFDIFVFWCTRNVMTRVIYRDKTQIFFLHEIFRAFICILMRNLVPFLRLILYIFFNEIHATWKYVTDLARGWTFLYAESFSQRGRAWKASRVWAIVRRISRATVYLANQKGRKWKGRERWINRQKHGFCFGQRSPIVPRRTCFSKCLWCMSARQTIPWEKARRLGKRQISRARRVPVFFFLPSLPSKDVTRLPNPLYSNRIAFGRHFDIFY